MDANDTNRFTLKEVFKEVKSAKDESIGTNREVKETTLYKGTTFQLQLDLFRYVRIWLFVSFMEVFKLDVKISLV